MLQSQNIFRTKLLAQVAAATLLSIFAAGCSSDVERFASNPFGNPFSESAPTGSIGSQAGAVQPAPSGGPISASPLPPPSAAPYGAAPSTYNAAPYGAPPAQQAYGAGAGAPPPQSGAYVPGGAPRPSGNSHVVAPGETLYSVSRLYNIRPADLASANGLTTDSKVRVGQHLTLPGGVAPKSGALAKPPVATPPVKTAGAPAAGQLPVMSAEKSAETPKAAEAAPAAKVTPAVARPEEGAKIEEEQPAAKAAGNGEVAFRWPVRGRIISGFGPKPNGVSNDGVNLSVPEGTPIKASEGGVVAYAGSELKGYGNLVLIRHPGGWVTAYAHASEILVKRGDTIKRGQVIGKVGQSGGVSAPQLHFEVRRGSTPVDPMLQLPNG